MLRDRSGEGRIEAKRNWLENVFEDGLVIRKGDVPGRAFMEYVPAEDAWCCVDAPGYMFIHCYRIDDKWKDGGYDKAIWREVTAECRIKHKKGFCVLVGSEEKSFLNKKEDFVSRGFKTAALAEPYFELMYLPFEEPADEEEIPCFLSDDWNNPPEDEGFVIYYSHQCPHTAKAVPLLEKKAKELGIPLKTIRLEKPKDFRAVRGLYTAFTLFFNGEFVTHEIPTPAAFVKLVKKYK